MKPRRAHRLGAVFLSLAGLSGLVEGCRATAPSDDPTVAATTSAGTGGSFAECTASTVELDCGAPEACFAYACEGGECVEKPFEKGTPCEDKGGDTCNGNGTCVLGSCMDGFRNGSETDVDCGGNACELCELDLRCVLNTDCTTGFCGPASDGRQGGGGGAPSTTLRCQLCTSTLDCNNDSFCDTTAGTCVKEGPAGDPCTSGDTCVSGHCVDGVCCESACDGTCEACSLTKNGTADGTCAPVSAGEDPDDECGFAPGACTGNVCDGLVAACAAAPASTTCRDTDGDCDLEELCDGTSLLCPTDAVQPSSVVCRTAMGDCDLAESCDGAAKDCPTDSLMPASTPCGEAPDVCDVQDACDASGQCIDGGFVPLGEQGGCGAGEFCNSDHTCEPT
jgi:hypothetical protein